MQDQDHPAGGASLSGRLLVAEPALADPNFARTVVYLIEHALPAGAIGLVLNRPSPVTVDQIVPEWAPYVSDPAVVFTGGPVTPEGALCLARCRSAGPVEVTDDEPAPAFRPITTSIGVLDLHRDPTEAPGGVTALRIFGGYAGWSAGQLEEEIAAGGWFVLDAQDDDCFTDAPDALWSEVLGRQQGPLRAVAHFPDDPAVN